MKQIKINDKLKSERFTSDKIEIIKEILQNSTYDEFLEFIHN